LREAIEIHRRLAGENKLNLAKGLEILGDVLVCQNDDRARVPYYEVVEIRTKLLGQDPVVARTMNKIGDNDFPRGFLPTAEMWYRKALDIQQKQLAPKDPARAATMMKLGRVLKEQGNPTDADTMYVNAILILQDSKGAEPETEIAMLALAELKRFAPISSASDANELCSTSDKEVDAGLLDGLS